MSDVWMAYLLGAVFTLVWKWGAYCYHGRKAGRSIISSTGEYCFEGSRTNAVSWVTTIGVVWVIGSAYIDQATWLFGGVFKSVPVTNSIAFLLGSLMELTVPTAMKWLALKIPFLKP